MGHDYRLQIIKLCYCSYSNIVSAGIYTLTAKGEVLSDLGNYTGALLYYNKVLTIDPHYVRALTDKGTALDDLGNHTGAELYHDKVLDMLKHPNLNK
jgi:Flp pilus assembly protein TadD